MNNVLALLVILLAGFGLGTFFLRRSLVDRAEGAHVPTTPRFGFFWQHTFCARAWSWPDSISSRLAIGEKLLACLLGFVIARCAITWFTRGGDERNRCALAPTNWSSGSTAFFKLNATIVYTWGLMLVLALGSKLITRRLKPGLRVSRWECALEIIVTAIGKQNRGSRCEAAREISRFCGHSLSFHRAGQSLHDCAGIRSADRFAFHHGGAGPLRVYRRASLWNRGAGAGRLPEILSRADGDHAAVQSHGPSFSRTLAMAVRLFRQHDERNDDPEHSVHRHALHFFPP